MTGSQLSLMQTAPEHVGGVQSIGEAFRRLYYHLYTNGNASRSERIIHDLSQLLLTKLACDIDGTQLLDDFLASETASSSFLLERAREHFEDSGISFTGFSIGESAVRDALAELARLDLLHAPAHVLGEAFQALVGPRLRGERGQFFTPHSLVRAIVQIVAPKATESVIDPACGTGGFLVEAHAFLSQKAEAITGVLQGYDKDQDLATLATALLRISTGNRAAVHNADSLDVLLANEGTFDVVLTNPPFGAKIGLKDPSVLSKYELAHVWSNAGSKWSKSNRLLSSQDPQTLFLELCIRLLRPGGRLGIVLPEGVFGNKGQGYVWHWVRTQGRITALLDCPRTTFQPGTDTKTNVLIFQKEALIERKKAPTWIGVALRCGHDRRGRTHKADGTPYANDFARLATSFAKAGRTGWIRVDSLLPEYLVPRYYADEQPSSDEEMRLVTGAPVATLGELLKQSLVSVRKGHEVGAEAYGTGSIPFVRTSDISNFEIRSDPTAAVSEDVFEKYRVQQRLRPGDVIIVVDGRYRIGSAAILTKSNYRCVVQSHLRVISIKNENELDPYELLFALTLPSVRLRIRDLVFVQSTLGTLGSRLLELKIPLLHGQGPWRESVDRFRSALEVRDRLLGELRHFGDEVEL